MPKRFGAVSMQLGAGAGHAFTRQEMKEHMDYTCNMIDWSVDQFGLHAPAIK